MCDNNETLLPTIELLDSDFHSQGFEIAYRIVKMASCDLDAIYALAEILDKRKEAILALSNIVCSLSREEE